jgi:hypothetical protein
METYFAIGLVWAFIRLVCTMNNDSLWDAVRDELNSTPIVDLVGAAGCQAIVFVSLVIITIAHIVAWPAMMVWYWLG